MNNSEHQPELQGVVDVLLDRLDDTAIANHVDSPIQASADGFALDRFLPVSHRTFHAAIGGLVQHLHQHGLTPHQQLSFERALAEAIHVLQSQYEGTHFRGYDAAYLDAMEPAPGGLGGVLQRMTASIIATQRQRYVQCVLARILAPLGWAELCRLVEVLLQQDQAVLRTHLSQGRPAQLLDDIPELITALAGSRRLPRQIANAVA
jgi:hypothetical protein